MGDGPVPDKPNRREPGRLNTGITVVGKRAVMPRGARIGRNVKVAADIRSTDFTKRVIPSGESVEAKPGTRRPHDHGEAAARAHAVAAGIGRGTSRGKRD